MTQFRRIGRAPNVAERGVMFVQEDARVLLHVAVNLIAHTAGILRGDAAQQWAAMREHDRDAWRGRAIERLRQDAAGYVPPTDPDDPDPGASWPSQSEAVA